MEFHVGNSDVKDHTLPVTELRANRAIFKRPLKMEANRYPLSQLCLKHMLFVPFILIHFMAKSSKYFLDDVQWGSLLNLPCWSRGRYWDFSANMLRMSYFSTLM